MEVPEPVDAEAIKTENRELRGRILELEEKVFGTEKEVRLWA